MCVSSVHMASLSSPTNLYPSRGPMYSCLNLEDWTISSSENGDSNLWPIYTEVIFKNDTGHHAAPYGYCLWSSGHQWKEKSHDLSRARKGISHSGPLAQRPQQDAMATCPKKGLALLKVLEAFVSTLSAVNERNTQPRSVTQDHGLETRFSPDTPPAQERSSHGALEGEFDMHIKTNERAQTDSLSLCRGDKKQEATAQGQSSDGSIVHHEGRKSTNPTKGSPHAAVTRQDSESVYRRLTPAINVYRLIREVLCAREPWRVLVQETCHAHFHGHQLSHFGCTSDLVLVGRAHVAKKTASRGSGVTDKGFWQAVTSNPSIESPQLLLTLQPPQGPGGPGPLHCCKVSLRHDATWSTSGEVCFDIAQLLSQVTLRDVALWPEGLRLARLTWHPGKLSGPPLQVRVTWRRGQRPGEYTHVRISYAAHPDLAHVLKNVRFTLSGLPPLVLGHDGEPQGAAWPEAKYIPETNTMHWCVATILPGVGTQHLRLRVMELNKRLPGPGTHQRTHRTRSEGGPTAQPRAPEQQGATTLLKVNVQCDVVRGQMVGGKAVCGARLCWQPPRNRHSPPLPVGGLPNVYLEHEARLGSCSCDTNYEYCTPSRAAPAGGQPPVWGPGHF